MQNTTDIKSGYSSLEYKLVCILQRHVGERGDNEGAVEVLERILHEREVLLRNAIKEKVFRLV